MNIGQQEPSSLVMGLQILFLFTVPIVVVYWIRSVIMPPAPKKIETAVVYRSIEIFKLRPKALRYCPLHLTNIPKGRIALVVDASRCQLCDLGRKMR